VSDRDPVRRIGSECAEGQLVHAPTAKWHRDDLDRTGAVVARAYDTVQRVLILITGEDVRRVAADLGVWELDDHECLSSALQRTGGDEPRVDRRQEVERLAVLKDGVVGR
jgi:hypothetical protein